MDSSNLVGENLTLKRQRGIFAIGAIAATLIAVIMSIVAFSKDREVIILPVLEEQLKLQSQSITKEYMEMLTRDTAYMMLNRSPDSMDYWLPSVMRIVDPTAHGKIKADLLQIVENQRGSSVAQYFTMKSMKINTETLVTEVQGTLTSSVGSQRVKNVERIFRFKWKQRGVGVRLVGFEIVKPDGVKDQ